MIRTFRGGTEIPIQIWTICIHPSMTQDLNSSKFGGSSSRRRASSALLPIRVYSKVSFDAAENNADSFVVFSSFVPTNRAPSSAFRNLAL